MISYSTKILQFGEQGEKTGWTYIVIHAEQAIQMGHEHKKSFRVKGKLDAFEINAVALIPMGNGDFILPINASIRKGIRKKKGAMLQVCLEKDDTALKPLPELMECLQDEPVALAYFNTLPPSHQKYYSNWIGSAKTEITRSKRIATAVNTLSHKMHFGEMMRWLKSEKEKQ